MASLNFGDLGQNAANLGKDLLAGLTNDLLSHVKDPVQLDAITRATATIAASPIGLLGASPEMQAQIQEDRDTALTVLLSYASADAEDAAAAAAAAQAKLKAFVNNFLQEALATAFKAALFAA